MRSSHENGLLVLLVVVLVPLTCPLRQRAVLIGSRFCRLCAAFAARRPQVLSPANIMLPNQTAACVLRLCSRILYTRLATHLAQCMSAVTCLSPFIVASLCTRAWAPPEQRFQQ
jgi:hypothetical protein